MALQRNVKQARRRAASVGDDGAESGVVRNCM